MKVDSELVGFEIFHVVLHFVARACVNVARVRFRLLSSALSSNGEQYRNRAQFCYRGINRAHR